MMVPLRYIGIIENVDVMIRLQEDDFCDFICHFGIFGHLEIYDIFIQETVLRTQGTIIEKFYPDIEDRKYAEFRTQKNLYPLFQNHKEIQKRKYPKGHLKEIYKWLLMCKKEK